MCPEGREENVAVDREVSLFKAFSDATRLRILFLLTERELCVCELVGVLDMPQGKVSRHLAHLRHAGLVIDRRDGTWVHYRLAHRDTPLIQALFAYLSAERLMHPTAARDLERLKALGAAGALCVPRDGVPSTP